MSRIEASKNLNYETTKLEPSSIIALFEIDISSIVFENKLSDIGQDTVFRFHNNLKLTSNNIIWKGVTYIAAPIMATRFEVSSKGTLPTPQLEITVNEEGVSSFSDFKTQISRLGDLAGAKVTRMRTFAKYLDADNFVGQEAPKGFSPNPFSEFPKDIFFIDRKIGENKTLLQYELVSPLDLENLKLPSRIGLADRCVASYRGEGCLYEFDGSIPDLMRRNETIHGSSDESTLPEEALPVATQNNELIYGEIITDGTSAVNKGEWVVDTFYEKGDFVYIEKNNLKYYFVAKIDAPKDKAPPDLNYWVSDSCSKLVSGCRLRWADKGLGHLPYVGFPAMAKAG